MILDGKLNKDRKFEVLTTSHLIEVYKLAEELSLSLDFLEQLANAIKIRQAK